MDEVDSILIDEARTPLIISGPAEESTDKYYRIDKIIPKLIQDIDYTVEEKHQHRHADRRGRQQNARGCWASATCTTRSTWKRFTTSTRPCARTRSISATSSTWSKTAKSSSSMNSPGREMPGRRWSDGLHQAVEAKEGVKIERENQTLATITFQNYFRMYKKLSGMTGTAETEATEFDKIYKLDVSLIPTNRPLRRAGIFRRRLPHGGGKIRSRGQRHPAGGRHHAHGIRQIHEAGQPVLVGTISIEKSEHLANC